LLTNLLDAARYPAAELVDLYHERWQAETAYFSIKATMLDGRVLRSRSLEGLDQEVYALLTTYQALIRAACDTVHARPGLDMDRISFTVLRDAAADTVTTGRGILPSPAPPTSSAPSARPSSTPCAPPGAAAVSRPAAERTPPASTARTPDNAP
jgi:hypothetical protein